jgi:hypothetical protein
METVATDVAIVGAAVLYAATLACTGAAIYYLLRI